MTPDEIQSATDVGDYRTVQYKSGIDEKRYTISGVVINMHCTSNTALSFIIIKTPMGSFMPSIDRVDWIY